MRGTWKPMSESHIRAFVEHRRCSLLRHTGAALILLLALASTMTSMAGAAPVRHTSFTLPSAGDLDPNFGADGMVTTDVGPDVDSADAIAIQPDGKILAAGEIAYGAAFGLVRYNPNGTLDATFGDAGIVATDIAPSGAYAIALQADGKIVVAGGGRRFALVRYTPDGTLDPTFDGDGVVTTNFNPYYDLAYAVAIQADGKIVAAGVSSIESRTFIQTTPRPLSARYNTDGNLDTSFGGDGRVTTDFTGTYDAARSVVIQVDGMIVVAGTAGGYRTFALVRYNRDGTRDSSFGEDGKVTTRFRPRTQAFAFAIAVQADGRLVAVGTEPRSAGFGLVRYSTDGALVASFGTDGLVTTDFLTRHDLGYVGGWARGVADLQADDKIVVVGGARSDQGRRHPVRVGPVRVRWNAGPDVRRPRKGRHRVVHRWERLRVRHRESSPMARSSPPGGRRTRPTRHSRSPVTWPDNGMARMAVLLRRQG